MIFNVAAANCDDHSKNFSFLFDPKSGWQLAPAYDVTYAYNSESQWVHQHLMSVNGRFEGIARGDILEVAERFGIEASRAILDEVLDAVGRWGSFAKWSGVPDEIAAGVADDHLANALRR